MNKRQADVGLMSLQEIEEDLLEQVYSVIGEGQRALSSAIIGELRFTRREYNQALERLEKKDMILLQPDEAAEDVEIQLTGKGKRLAADVIRRHHYIKDFLKMVCNVGDQVADRDACRFEHIASEEVLSGIREFVRSGRVANRVIKGQDLNVVYMPGSYIFDVGFYECFTSSPRVFCEENAAFKQSVKIEINQESIFQLELTEESFDKTMWYMDGSRWRKSRREGKYMYIPNCAFDYTVSGSLPVLDGDGFVAFIGENRAPQDADIRAINVHLW